MTTTSEQIKERQEREKETSHADRARAAENDLATQAEQEFKLGVTSVYALLARFQEMARATFGLRHDPASAKIVQKTMNAAILFGRQAGVATETTGTANSKPAAESFFHRVRKSADDRRARKLSQIATNLIPGMKFGSDKPKKPGNEVAAEGGG